MIHFQHFPATFDSDVVFPPHEHGNESKRVGNRRERVKLLDLFHLDDGFLVAIRLS